MALRVLPLSSSDQSENKVSQLIKFHQTQSLFIKLSKQLSVTLERFFKNIFIQALPNAPALVGGHNNWCIFCFQLFYTFSRAAELTVTKPGDCTHQGEILANLPRQLYIEEIQTDTDSTHSLCYHKSKKGDQCCWGGRPIITNTHLKHLCVPV